jgi:hypothetical protein
MPGGLTSTALSSAYSTAKSGLRLVLGPPLLSSVVGWQEIRRRRADGISGHEQPYRGETNDWLTPRYILDALGKFDLDPCAALDQPWATARRPLTVKDDGLKKPWVGRVWLNPPYGEQTALCPAKPVVCRTCQPCEIVKNVCKRVTVKSS